MLTKPIDIGSLLEAGRRSPYLKFMVATYALAAEIYPTAVLSAGVGSWMLDRGGYPLFFGMMAGAMAVCFLGLAVIQRHIQRAALETLSRPQFPVTS